MMAVADGVDFVDVAAHCFFLPELSCTSRRHCYHRAIACGMGPRYECATDGPTIPQPLPGSRAIRERVNTDPELRVIGDWFTTTFALTFGESAMR